MGRFFLAIFIAGVLNAAAVTVTRNPMDTLGWKIGWLTVFTVVYGAIHWLR